MLPRYRIVSSRLDLLSIILVWSAPPQVPSPPWSWSFGVWGILTPLSSPVWSSCRCQWLSPNPQRTPEPAPGKRDSGLPCRPPLTAYPPAVNKTGHCPVPPPFFVSLGQPIPFSVSRRAAFPPPPLNLPSCHPKSITLSLVFAALAFHKPPCPQRSNYRRCPTCHINPQSHPLETGRPLCRGIVASRNNTKLNHLTWSQPACRRAGGSYRQCLGGIDHLLHASRTLTTPELFLKAPHATLHLVPQAVPSSSQQTPDVSGEKRAGRARPRPSTPTPTRTRRSLEEREILPRSPALTGISLLRPAKKHS